MSSALALAWVTSVLKDLLANRFIKDGVTASVGDVTVSVLPPDRVATGTDERIQLNLFMYRITPHTMWRSSKKAFNGQQERHAGPMPLALDLHYLLTAYGEQDFHAEILLGYAMQLLHETPVLTRSVMESVLASDSLNGLGSALPPTRAVLAKSMLADQVEEITISLDLLSGEETSRLWSSLQSRYRPSAAYKVSKVLIEVDR